VVEHTMEVAGWLRKQLEEAHPDLLRAMVKEMAEALMGAEAEALCGAGYGERSPERVNRRNGYRERDWDTRVGSIELAVPKLREGSYFPGWLLQPRRRAEQAFVSVIAGSTREPARFSVYRWVVRCCRGCGLRSGCVGLPSLVSSCNRFASSSWRVGSRARSAAGRRRRWGSVLVF
jgi:hypothetical protein